MRRALGGEPGAARDVLTLNGGAAIYTGGGASTLAGGVALAQTLGADLIGINNRDLHTFKTDIATTEELLRDYSGPALIVGESGIETPEHIRRLDRAGARAFLIGESLLRGGAPRAALAPLTQALAPPGAASR